MANKPLYAHSVTVDADTEKAIVKAKAEGYSLRKIVELGLEAIKRG